MDRMEWRPLPLVPLLLELSTLGGFTLVRRIALVYIAALVILATENYQDS